MADYYIFPFPNGIKCGVRNVWGEGGNGDPLTVLFVD